MVSVVADFTPLERAALDAVLDEIGEHRGTVSEQLQQASVLSRENTGGGFFTDLKVASEANALDRKTAHFGQNVWISIEGLEYGLGLILHVKDGRANLLEGYAVGPEDTSGIDFEKVRFAVAKEPGGLRTSGS
jgi:hypothetical protein